VASNDSPSKMTAFQAIAKPRAGDLAQPIMAGVLASLVGYASSFTLVLGGLAHMGASAAEAASGLFAMCLALGLLNTIVTWRTRVPLSFAWTTPGAAFLLTLQPIEGGFPAVTGAFVMVAVLVLACGFIRPLARVWGGRSPPGPWAKRRGEAPCPERVFRIDEAKSLANAIGVLGRSSPAPGHFTTSAEPFPQISPLSGRPLAPCG